MSAILSFDAETDGLYGPVLAVGAVVYRDGRLTAKFEGRVAAMPAPGTGWVGDNVTPACEGMPVYADRMPTPVAGIGGGPMMSGDAVRAINEEMARRTESGRGLLPAFTAWYLEHKAGCDIVAHMPVPVEAGLLIEMRRAGLIGDWDGPYPLHDVAGCLAAAGADPTSVDKYLAAAGIDITTRPEGRTTVYDLYEMYSGGACGSGGGGRAIGRVHTLAAARAAAAAAKPTGYFRGITWSEQAIPLAPHHPVYDAVGAAVAYARLRGSRAA